MIDDDIRALREVIAAGPWTGETANGNYITAASPDRIARLLDEIERLLADAERYRWLRDPSNAYNDAWNYFGPYSTCEEIDAAIDAARKEERK